MRKTYTGNSGNMSMSSGQNTGGLMSSAGLVRYFDSEDRNAINIDPKTVMAFSILFGVTVQLLSITAG